MLCGTRLLDVAHAAVNLNAKGGHIAGGFGAPAFDDGNEKVEACLMAGARFQIGGRV